jgi:heme/copper-type cytochrome/quinol oxidase subunit 2
MTDQSHARVSGKTAAKGAITGYSPCLMLAGFALTLLWISVLLGSVTASYCPPPGPNCYNEASETQLHAIIIGLLFGSIILIVVSAALGLAIWRTRRRSMTGACGVGGNPIKV